MVGALVRRFGSLDVAEEAAADAFATAVERWRTDGVPPNPGGWLTTTAGRKALDRLRRTRVQEEKYELVEATRIGLDETVDDETDERLRLLLICCHPTLPLEGRVALTLRMVAGLTVPEIARAFLVPEPTVGQRISRAKAKVRSAALPFVMPSQEELEDRIGGVLAVLYLVFNEGYLSTGAHRDAVRHDLVLEAIRLTRTVRTLLPRDGEVSGLLALMLFAEARHATRLAPDGSLQTLDQQDRGAWDHAMIGQGLRLLREADRAGIALGRYRILATISATHCSAAASEDTDWPRIVVLYDLLLQIDPSPIVRLNRAVAVGEVLGPARALAEIDVLRDRLPGYQPYYAVRAELLRRLGRHGEAASAYESGIALSRNAAERAFLLHRLEAARRAEDAP